MRKTLLGLATAAALLPVAAQAQDAAPLYREGMPAVLTPQSDAASAAPAAGFAEAYKRAGRPRVVVFWMRRLSDMVKAPEVMLETTVGAGAVSVARTYGGATAGVGYVEQRATVEGTLTEGADDRLGERNSLAAESAFMAALRGAGVTLVDRNAIIRLSSEAGNQQAAETAAIAGKADVLVEVTAAGYGAMDGMMYRISAIRTSDGRSLASDVLDPEDVDLVSYEASSSGGYHPVVEPERLGRALAQRLQAQLAASW